MDFTRLLEKTLKFEGGYSNHPSDRGGHTKFGITLSTLKSLSLDINGDGVIDADDIKSLTKDQAVDIYKKHYFQKALIDALPDVIQPILFDMSVNHGPRTAIRILQHVLNQSGLAVIEVDGVIGNVTARACEQVYELMGHFLINALCDERQNFYHRIVINAPDQEVFAKGWKRRTDAYRVESEGESV